MTKPPGYPRFTFGGVELMGCVSFTTTIVIGVLYMKGMPSGPMVFVMNPELIDAVFIAINSTVFGITVMLVLGILAYLMDENGIPVAPSNLGICDQSALAGTVADVNGGRARK